jgi:hypothetical protein
MTYKKVEIEREHKTNSSNVVEDNEKYKEAPSDLSGYV